MKYNFLKNSMLVGALGVGLCPMMQSCFASLKGDNMTIEASPSAGNYCMPEDDFDKLKLLEELYRAEKRYRDLLGDQQSPERLFNFNTAGNILSSKINWEDPKLREFYYRSPVTGFVRNGIRTSFGMSGWDKLLATYAGDIPIWRETLHTAHMIKEQSDHITYLRQTYSRGKKSLNAFPNLKCIDWATRREGEFFPLLVKDHQKLEQAWVFCDSKCRLENLPKFKHLYMFEDRQDVHFEDLILINLPSMEVLDLKSARVDSLILENMHLTTLDISAATIGEIKLKGSSIDTLIMTAEQERLLDPSFTNYIYKIVDGVKYENPNDMESKKAPWEIVAKLDKLHSKYMLCNVDENDKKNNILSEALRAAEKLNPNDYTTIERLLQSSVLGQKNPWTEFLCEYAQSTKNGFWPLQAHDLNPHSEFLDKIAEKITTLFVSPLLPNGLKPAVLNNCPNLRSLHFTRAEETEEAPMKMSHLSSPEIYLGKLKPKIEKISFFSPESFIIVSGLENLRKIFFGLEKKDSGLHVAEVALAHLPFLEMLNLDNLRVGFLTLEDLKLKKLNISKAEIGAANTHNVTIEELIRRPGQKFTKEFITHTEDTTDETELLKEQAEAVKGIYDLIQNPAGLNTELRKIAGTLYEDPRFLEAYNNTNSLLAALKAVIDSCGPEDKYLDEEFKWQRKIRLFVLYSQIVDHIKDNDARKKEIIKILELLKSYKNPDDDFSIGRLTPLVNILYPRAAYLNEECSCCTSHGVRGYAIQAPYINDVGTLSNWGDPVDPNETFFDKKSDFFRCLPHHKIICNLLKKIEELMNNDLRLASLLRLNKDFDDDLLQDAIELLRKE